MPVEIRELVIRAVVSSERSGNNIDTGRKPSLAQEDKDALIAECVEQVLKILKKQRER
ncbi:MAG: DUF5908 family protein [Gammaproteobacteria bacterium]